MAMILTLEPALKDDELAQVNAALEQQRFVDGRQTVGRVVRDIKRNTELPVDSPLRRQLSGLIGQALWRSSTFRVGVMPRTVSGFLFSRYGPGMTYGDHIDDPLMGEGGEPMRSDLSITLFLNPPDAYEGGELVIDSDGAGQTVKLPAGCAVVYPTTSIHRVNPVTAGERRVAVAWIQSMIRDPAQREIAWDLARVLEWAGRIERERPDDGSDSYRLLQKSRANLVRMWADV